VGLCLLLAAAALWLYGRWDAARADAAVAQAAQQMQAVLLPGSERLEPPEEGGSEAEPDQVPEGSEVEAEPEPPDYLSDPEMEMPVVRLDGRDYIGQLDIPELGLSLPVLSQWSDSNLKIAPCRYQGSAYLENLILAAHNYKSHFGRLWTLQVGSQVTFTDMDGNVFRYEVTQMQKLQPTALAEMEQGDWALTLFTCTAGGSARLAVRCAAVTE
jgi:sortase A